jgi:hypothetical protein
MMSGVEIKVIGSITSAFRYCEAERGSFSKHGKDKEILTLFFILKNMKNKEFFCSHGAPFTNQKPT